MSNATPTPADLKADAELIRHAFEHAMTIQRQMEFFDAALRVASAVLAGESIDNTNLKKAAQALVDRLGSMALGVTTERLYLELKNELNASMPGKK